MSELGLDVRWPDMSEAQRTAVVLTLMDKVELARRDDRLKGRCSDCAADSGSSEGSSLEVQYRRLPVVAVVQESTSGVRGRILVDT